MAPEDANLQTRAVQMETPTHTYSQPCIPAQVQAKEADVQALAQLTRALDKKVLAFACFSAKFVAFDV